MEPLKLCAEGYFSYGLPWGMRNSACKELGIAAFMNDEYGRMWKEALVA